METRDDVLEGYVEPEGTGGGRGGKEKRVRCVVVIQWEAGKGTVGYGSGKLQGTVVLDDG
jgi:hypothetical protein